MERLNTFARQLRRHAERRREGVPTVTLVLGRLEEHAARLRCSIAAEGNELEVVAPASPDMLADAWMRALTRRHHLRDIAFSVITGAQPELAEVLRAQWGSRSSRERELWLNHMSADARMASTRAALEWLQDSSIVRDMSGGVEGPMRALSRLAEWVPASTWPALLVAASSAVQLEGLAALAIAAPRLPLLAVLDEQAWHDQRSRVSSRARSLLSEGLVLLRELPEMLVAGHPDAPSPGPGAPERESMRSDRELALLVEQANEACRRAQAVAAQSGGEDTQASELARSLAELLLFEMLERDTVTSGLFALNATLPFDFGNQPAEIDLLCRSLDLAVEVDGYFHFTDAVRYRRDRRKDVLLQTQGLWVSRYLATDVVERGEDVMSSIRTLVEARKQTTVRGSK